MKHIKLFIYYLFIPIPKSLIFIGKWIAVLGIEIHWLLNELK